MFGDILTNLLAAAIMASIGWIWTRRWFLALIRERSKRLAVNFTQRNSHKRLSPEQRVLLDKLLADQSLAGTHLGEFGNQQRHGEVEAYNRNREDIATKPRMHMTRWPCRILTKHGLAGDRVSLSLQRIKTLLGSSATILADDPFPAYQVLGAKPKRIINFRHTQCGALIQYETIGETAQTLSVVERMTTKETTWQNADGGWTDCSTFSEVSDIFSSSYALQILFKASERSLPAISPLSVKRRIRSTVSFMRDTWHKNQWSFGEFSGYEIAPQIFPEICHVLERIDKPLHDEVATFLCTMLTENGNIPERILNMLDQSVSVYRQKIRLLYCLHQCGVMSRSQIIMITSLVSEVPTQYASSVEFSMLLDLSLDANQS